MPEPRLDDDIALGLDEEEIEDETALSLRSSPANLALKKYGTSALEANSSFIFLDAANGTLIIPLLILTKLTPISSL
jgi:hypothetical protein